MGSPDPSAETPASTSAPASVDAPPSPASQAPAAKALYWLIMVSFTLLLASGGAMVYSFGALNAAANTPTGGLVPAPNLTLPWAVYWGGIAVGFASLVLAIVVRGRAGQRAHEELKGLAAVAMTFGIIELVALACGGMWLSFATSFCRQGC